MKQIKQTISDNVLFNSFLCNDSLILADFFSKVRQEFDSIIRELRQTIVEFLDKNAYDYDTFDDYWSVFFEDTNGDFGDFCDKRNDYSLTRLDFSAVYTIDTDLLSDDYRTLYFPSLFSILNFSTEYLRCVDIFCIFEIYHNYKNVLFLLPFVFEYFVENQKES